MSGAFKQLVAAAQKFSTTIFLPTWRKTSAVVCLFLIHPFCLSRWLAEQNNFERRLVYVIPEALPANYRWQFGSSEFTDIVWVGYQFNQRGELKYRGKSTLAPLLKDRRQQQYLLLSPENTAAGTTILTDAMVAEGSRNSVARLLAQYPEINGVQFDFEYLPARLANNYTVYIKKMREFIHRRVKVQVAVFPPVDFSQKWAGFHDLPALAATADSIVVMLYDRHRPGTKAGCVTPLGWLQNNIDKLKNLPRAKVWLGAPLYGYQFSAKGVKAIGKGIFESYSTPYSYEDGCLVKKLEAGSLLYYPSNELYSAYYTVYRKYGFAGLAFWRAGWEH